MSDSERWFAKLQEAIRKDVERAFGVLQAKWAIVGMPARLWSVDTLSTIMKCCAILHNMCVEDRIAEFGDSVDPESVASALNDYESGRIGGEEVRRARFTAIPVRRARTFAEFVNRTNEVQDQAIYFERRRDLIQHCWDMKGRQQN